MNWRHPVFVGLLWVLTFIAAARGETGVSVSNAWVREAPPGVAMMAGYMALQNNTSRSQVLVAARSSDFDTVMIHRTVVKDGMAGMVHTSQIELSPNASLIFAPGGYHLMLMNSQRTLRAGNRVVIDDPAADAG